MGVRTVRDGDFGRFGRLFPSRLCEILRNAQSFPPALRFGVGVQNVMARRDPELPNHLVSDDARKLIARQRCPAPLSAELDISCKTVGYRKIPPSLAPQAFTSEHSMGIR